MNVCTLKVACIAFIFAKAHMVRDGEVFIWNF